MESDALLPSRTSSSACPAYDSSPEDRRCSTNSNTLSRDVVFLPAAPCEAAGGRTNVSRWILNLRRELPALIRLSWPTSLTGFCTVALPLVSLLFGGRLGRQQLAAVGLATMLANVTGASVIQGLLTAFDTLGSQVCAMYMIHVLTL